MPTFGDAETNEINFLLSESSKERRQMCQRIDQRVQSKYFGGRLDAVCWGAGRRWGGGRAGFLGVVILELNCER